MEKSNKIMNLNEARKYLDENLVQEVLDKSRFNSEHNRFLSGDVTQLKMKDVRLQEFFNLASGGMPSPERKRDYVANKFAEFVSSQNGNLEGISSEEIINNRKTKDQFIEYVSKEVQNYLFQSTENKEDFAQRILRPLNDGNLKHQNEKILLENLYGIKNEPSNEKEIAGILGRTKTRVGQLKWSAKAKLKNGFSGETTAYNEAYNSIKANGGFVSDSFAQNKLEKMAEEENSPLKEPEPDEMIYDPRVGFLIGKEIRDYNIEDLDLTNNAYNSLKGRRIKTIKDLNRKKLDDLKLPKKSYKELKELPPYKLNIKSDESKE